jgi:putative oxidoreductase
MEKVMNLTGRILIAQLFLMAGISKIPGYEATQGYMEAMGVPGGLLPLVILLEIGGAIALIVGFQMRWVALALAGFSVVSAAMFHNNFADQMQMIMFMKNIAVAGDLVILAGIGAGELSLDAKFKRSVTA